MFHRVGVKAYKADLHNILAISEVLDHPDRKFKTIHIAGTNGKGSTSHMLAAILQEAGYKTGLYTSPHLKDFRERIRINGQMIPEKKVTNFVAKHRNDFAKIEPSFFEMSVGLAFDYFAEKQVDIAIIETGLGGRLDSTNIITPLLSVITNIGFDHMAILGNTLEKIAHEKAGIIKPNIPVVIGQYNTETAPVFIQKAKECDSEIHFASEEYEVEYSELKNGYLNLNIDRFNKDILKNLELDLTGIYQKKNICTVLCAVHQLIEQGFKIDEKTIRSALKKVKESTGLMGRWYTILTHPLTICDTGHNEDGITEVVKQIQQTPHEHLHMVFGMVKDKDINHVLELLPKNATYYFCKADIPRGMDAEELSTLAREHGLKGILFSSVKDALKAAQTAAQAHDLVFVGGSTFVVAEVV
ncbi:bifunctional folylpolyglutamate synthase/dihydrofolate synthase [Solitalea koreensis]|nr:folylpolyglutamate synthase/dihydrofolate synthase family protein [Solitalea koreensis]